MSIKYILRYWILDRVWAVRGTDSGFIAVANQRRIEVFMNQRDNEKWINQNYAYMSVIDPEKHRQQSAKGGRISGEKKRQKALLKKTTTEMIENMFLEEVVLEEEMEMYKKFKRHQKYLEKKRRQKENGK